MTDPFRLDGRTALVTGGTSGIGLSTALLLRERGAEVVVCGRDAQRGEAVTAGNGLRFVRADVANEDDVRRLVEQCGPGLSAVVNNAGPTDLLHSRDVDGPVGVVTPDDWRRVLEATLTGVYLVTHAGLPALTRHERSAVVNVSSIAAAQAMPGFDAYAAAKSGVEALTRSTAVGYAHLGVRCNALRVGTVAVDHGDGGRRRSGHGDTRPDAWRYAAPPAAGRVEDVAHAALFLLTEAAAYVNGVVLPVDGGMGARSLMPWQTPLPERPVD